jgi:hypothetical protein
MCSGMSSAWFNWFNWISVIAFFNDVSMY